MFTPRGEHSLLFRRMEEQTENFNPRGQLYPYGTNFTPGGQLRPWGSKFAPGGEVKNGPLTSSVGFPINFPRFHHVMVAGGLEPTLLHSMAAEREMENGSDGSTMDTFKGSTERKRVTF
jgi:hypothetical protein